MKSNLIMLCLLGLAGILNAQEGKVHQSFTYKYEAVYRDLPFDMPRVEAPIFPDRKVNLADFGAIGNGEELCTSAFAKAIDALAEKGGAGT